MDGRYTLQVREQADPELYEFCSISADPPGSWIPKNALAGTRIGYDPWLHTQSGIAPLIEKCRSAQIHLIQVESNPLDQVWTDQPPAPLAPVYPHPVDIAGRSAAEKISEGCGGDPGAWRHGGCPYGTGFYRLAFECPGWRFTEHASFPWFCNPQRLRCGRPLYG